MLSRVANHLFWSGRYLERIESVSRYLQTQYFAGLDSEGLDDFKFTLSSIMNLAGFSYDLETLTEEQVLMQVMYEDPNNFSVSSYAELLKNNVCNIRESLSVQLYKSVNDLNNFISFFDTSYYKTRGLYELTQGIIERCNNIKSSINNTLLNNETWAILRLGSHLERTIQVNRILSTKFYDIEKLKCHPESQNILHYQFGVILDSLEAADMCKIIYPGSPNQETVLRFTLLEADFNKSMIYNLVLIQSLLRKIFPDPKMRNDQLFFEVDKLTDCFPYIDIEKIKEKPIPFLNKNLCKLVDLASGIEAKYLSY